jgi:hypothetical protein
MPSYANGTPPPWTEGESFRETTLHLIDDPADREAFRHAGRVLYDLAVEGTREVGTTPADPSITRAELRAVAADLRYTGGYLRSIRRSAEECSLEAAEEALALFAGRLARRVDALVEKIERRLS